MWIGFQPEADEDQRREVDTGCLLPPPAPDCQRFQRFQNIVKDYQPTPRWDCERAKAGNWEVDMNWLNIDGFSAQKLSQFWIGKMLPDQTENEMVSDHQIFRFGQLRQLQVNLCQKLERTSCVQKLFWMSETISVHNMFSPGLSLEFSCIELVIQWTICRHIVG